MKESENIAESTITDLDSELQAKKIANDIPSNVKVDYGIDTKVAKQRRQRRPRRAPRKSKSKVRKVRKSRPRQKGAGVKKVIRKRRSTKKTCRSSRRR